MPTLSYQYQGEGGCTSDKSPSNTPQSGTVSNTKNSNNNETYGSSSEKNNSFPSTMPPSQTQGTSAALCNPVRPSAYASLGAVQKNIGSLNSPRSQTQEATTTSPMSYATLKSPHQGDEGCMQSLKLGNSASATGAKSYAASLTSDKYQHHTEAKAPIKRTKKVAKPKSKAKAVSRAKKLPTKKNKPRASGPKPGGRSTITSDKQSRTTKRGGKPVPAKAKPASPPKKT